MDFEEKIRHFFEEMHPMEKPLLVGFSGGEDSLALVWALKKGGLSFHLAHFDHRWRERSANEAQKLKRWAEEAEIPFHLGVSKQPCESELLAREERYEFFHALFDRGEYAALVLAHHQKDQAETVLKRVLEGAHLASLKGMRTKGFHEGMPIWRPMLGIAKKEVENFLQREELIPIEDETNSDVRFLRARMREQILPSLSKQFGKEIVPSLSRLSDYGQELNEYLEEKTKDLAPLSGPFGLMWDFSQSHPLEIRYVLRQYFQPSRAIFEKILAAIRGKRVNMQVHFGKEKLVVDRGRLYWLKKQIPSFPQKVPLQEGVYEENRWKWILTDKGGTKGDFFDLWKGKICFTPSSKYEQFPAFLRPLLPKREGKGGDPMTIEIKLQT